MFQIRMFQEFYDEIMLHMGSLVLYFTKKLFDVGAKENQKNFEASAPDFLFK